MAKNNEKPTYTVEFKLHVELWQQHKIDKIMNVARQIYNAVLGRLEKNVRKIMENEYFMFLHTNFGRTKDEQKDYQNLLKKHGLSKTFANQFVKKMQHKYKHLINSAEAQKISERALATVEKILNGKAKKVRFKKYGEIISIEAKSNKSGVREHKDKPQHIQFCGMEIPYKIKTDFDIKTFFDKTKYCRIVKRVIRNKDMFFVQMVKEGYPPNKDRKQGKGDVGIDIGTSTIAVVSDEKSFFEPLIKQEDALKNAKKRLRVLQRKMDRSRRTMNPKKFNKDGTFNRKNEDRWVYSNRYKKLRKEYQSISYHFKMLRKQSHEALANRIIELGDNIFVENMSFKGLQKRSKKTTINKKNGKNNSKKRFGASLLNYAPASLISIINRKLKYRGKEIIKINPFQTKASQLNHMTGEYKKKSLSLRWNDFDGKKVHRDLYSAFLLQQSERMEVIEEKTVLKKGKEKKIKITKIEDRINLEKCHKKYENFLKMHDKIFA